MIRILNILLLLTALVGAFFVWRVRPEFDATRREHARLMAKVGRLPIQDSTKVHVLALESDDPLHFKWQVYIPANFKSRWESIDLRGGKSSSTSSTQDSRTDIVRVRFRKIDGAWHVWRKYLNGSSMGDVKYDELLEQPKLLKVQQLGKGQVKVVDSDEVATLLMLTTEQPPQPEDEGKPLMSFRFGSQDAWAKLKSKGK